MRPPIFVLALWLLTALTAGPAGAADAFYEQLKTSGIASFARGDFHTAAEDLRLACFGLLEEPVKLAEGLTYLALAQGRIADVPGLTRTFDRLLEVERRFEAFSQLDLDSERRQELEELLTSWVPYELLARAPVFRHVARRKLQAEILEMPPDERREALARQIATEPDHPPWRLLLAEAAFEVGDFESAWEAAESLLERGSPSARVHCVRARAGAALGWCEQALPGLDSCAEIGNALVEAKLRCHVSLQDWEGAAAVLAELSTEERQRAPFRQLARTVEKGRKEAARSADRAPGDVSAPAAPETAALPAPEAGAATPGEEPAAEAREPAPAPAGTRAGDPEVPAASAGTVSDGDSAAVPVTESPEAAQAIGIELERIRQVAAGGTRADLDAAFVRARRLAVESPGLSEPQLLTAELAYRLSRWNDVVTFTRRVGEPETQGPDHQFYLSVALYESGNRAEAREMLERCLARLEPTDFVRGYAKKILGSAASGG